MTPLSTARGGGGVRCVGAAMLVLLVLLYAARLSPLPSQAPTLRWQGDPAPPPAPTPPAPTPAPDFADGDDPSIKNHWALLVAGSSGYSNYRHQSDVAHAYRVVTEGGLLPQHVVVMAADDLAHHPSNPSPGKIFNHPRGPDNYRGGGFIDYRGKDVDAETFLAVLEGDSEAVAGKGTGRVIASGEDDRVFVFYSDHGSVGVLGMPSGPFLFADQLHASLRKKANADGFREMVMYIEACEAGSMFQGMLPDYDAECGKKRRRRSGDEREGGDGGDSGGSGDDDDVIKCEAPHAPPSLTHRRRRLSFAPSLRAFLADAVVAPPSPDEKKHHGGKHHRRQRGPPILATTAANADESSWATYCPSFAPGGGGGQEDADRRARGIPDDTCLGDLYSVAWMEESDASDLQAETLGQQFELVRERTSDGGTYEQGSHAMEYGGVRRLGWEAAGDYLGMMHRGSRGGAGGGGGGEEGGAATADDPHQGRALLLHSHQQRRPPPPPPASHPLRLRQHEAYTVPLVLAAQRARHAADLKAREAAEMVAAATAGGGGTDSSLLSLVETASISGSSSSRRDLLQHLEEMVASSAAEDAPNNNHATAAAAALLSAAREAEAAAAAADAALRADMDARRAVDVAARRAARVLLRGDEAEVGSLLLAKAAAANVAAINSTTEDETPLERALLRAEGPFAIPTSPDRPVVDDWDCLRAMVQAWGAQRQARGCSSVGGEGGGPALGQYTMRHTRLMAALCNHGVPAEAFGLAVEGVPCAIGSVEEERAALLLR
jgi:hypothetical protein